MPRYFVAIVNTLEREVTVLIPSTMAKRAKVTKINISLFRLYKQEFGNLDVHKNFIIPPTAPWSIEYHHTSHCSASLDTIVSVPNYISNSFITSFDDGVLAGFHGIFTPLFHLRDISVILLEQMFILQIELIIAHDYTK
jgi:hypothetical protein